VSDKQGVRISRFYFFPTEVHNNWRSFNKRSNCVCL